MTTFCAEHNISRKTFYDLRRAAPESSGLDHGPVSVHDKMRTMGLDPVPSTASPARIFRDAGVARLEPS